MAELEDTKNHGLDEFEKEAENDEELARMAMKEIKEEESEADPRRDPASGASGVIEGY